MVFVQVDRLVGGKKKSKSARVFFGKAKRAALLEDDPEMEPAQINRQGVFDWFMSVSFGLPFFVVCDFVSRLFLRC